MYTYLMSDHTKKNIHAGYCESVSKMVEWYKQWSEMSLFLTDDKYLNRLVYLEENSTEGQAIDRFTYFTFIPISERIKIIEGCNPTFMDLTTASNFDF
jgi:predicted GIY-YIG superfamily endonuclease